MSGRRLGIYLNDHLAGATAGLELARRARSSNEGTVTGELLDRLATEIEEDRGTLERLMNEVGVRRDRVKTSFAWSAEKLGRLKLNGQMTGYSPLSRLLELEGLTIGVAGKAALWRSLEAVYGGGLAGFDFAALADRADRQARELEVERRRAAADALAGEGVAAKNR